MKQYRILAAALAVLIPASSVRFPVSAAEIQAPERVTLDEVRDLRDYLLHAEYAKNESLPDMDGNGTLNAIDLSLAMAVYTRTNGLINLSADVTGILLGEEKTVTFTVDAVKVMEYSDAAPVLYDSSDAPLSEMYDDGTNGDETAGDGIYTAQIQMESDEIRNADFYAATDLCISKPYSICFYRPLTTNETDGYLDVLDQMSGFETFEDALAFVSGSDEIASYSVNEADQSISYKTIYYGCGFWEPVSEEDIQGRGRYAVPRSALNDYEKAEYAVKGLNFTPAHPNKKDVIALCPYHCGNLDFNDFEQAAALISTALGSEMKCYYDDTVTIDLMKQLAGYGTVLINTHGGQLNDGDTVFVIGERFDRDDREQVHAHSEDIIAERIYGTGDMHVAIRPAFIDAYYRAGDLNDSFWYLGSCQFLNSSAFETALRRKGAGAVVGFVESVHTLYDRLTLFELVVNSMLLSGDTVSGSVAESKRLNGALDYHLDANAHVEFTGAPDFRLVSEVYRPRFKVFDEGHIWQSARSLCRLYGGHLATITSSEEQAVVEAVLAEYGQRNAYWLGGLMNGTEVDWITGEKSSYTNWAPYMPDNAYHPEERCLMIYRNQNPVFSASTVMKWNDLANEGTFPGEPFFGLSNMGFICEWDE